MFKKNLRIAFRNFAKHKLSFFLTVIGFAVGLACSLLIFIYVCYEFSYESVFKDKNKIYRLGVTSKMADRSTEFATALPGLGPALKSSLPDIQEVVRIVNDNPKAYIRTAGSTQDLVAENILFAEPGFFQLFNFNIKEGKIDDFSHPNQIILTEALAAKLFDDQNPIGQMVIMNENRTKPLTVAAVIKGPPTNTHLKFDALVSWSTSLKQENVWDDAYAYTYFKILPDSKIDDVKRKITQFVQNNELIKSAQNKLNTTVVADVMAIKDIHLYSHRFNELSDGNSPDLLFMLLTIGIFFIICSGFNYVNIAIANSTYRSKEVGIRKVFGALAYQIRNQFFSESFIVVLISVAIALLIAILSLGKFSELVGQHLNVGIVSEPKFVLCFICMIIVIALISGGYPSFYISALKPVSILNKKSLSGGKLLIRKFLIVLQFVISTTVVGCTIIVLQQGKLIANADLGFDNQKILYFDVPGKSASDFLKQQFANEPGITSVSTSSYSPQNALNDEYSLEQENGGMQVFNVGRMFFDDSFVSLMNMRILQGRNFSPDFGSDSSSAFLVNEAMVAFSGWKKPLGKKINAVNFKKAGVVIGVIKDASLFSLHHKNAPMVISTSTDPHADGQAFFIKYNTSNVSGLIEKIKGYYKNNFGGIPFEYSFLDESYNRLYKSDERYKKIVLIGSFIMICISCLGLYGLSGFIAQKRKNEIGVRKILGASVYRIAVLYVKEFFILAVIGGIIAWPLFYYASMKWLQTFTLRIEIKPTIAVLSTFITILAVIITTLYHSVRLARVNPVDTIRE